MTVKNATVDDRPSRFDHDSNAKLKAELSALHAAVGKLEQEKEKLEMHLRQSEGNMIYMPGSPNNRLEAENKELRRLLESALADKDKLERNWKVQEMD